MSKKSKPESSSETSPLEEKIIQFLVFSIKIGRKVRQFFAPTEYYKRRHIEISWEEGRLYIDNFSHFEYVDYIGEQLEQLEFHCQPEDYIFESLKLAKHCNHIIFDSKEYGAYVHFRLGDGQIEFVWPMRKENNLKKYTLKMLDVLYSVCDSELTLNRRPKLPRDKKSLIKKDDLSGDYEVKLSFGRRIDLASKFANQVFIEVFKQEFKDLDIELG